MRDLDGVSQLAETLAIAGHTSQRSSEAVRAVISRGPTDQQGALRLADLPPVASGQLGRSVNRVAAARAEEDLRRHGRSLGQRLCELACRRVGEVEERGVRL